MCVNGDLVPVEVRIPADLSHTGEALMKEALIDRCIAPIVEALQKGGIDMRGSCCGHEMSDVGDIQLQDGRVLLVLKGTVARYWMKADREERAELMRTPS